MHTDDGRKSGRVNDILRHLLVTKSYQWTFKSQRSRIDHLMSLLAGKVARTWAFSGCAWPENGFHWISPPILGRFRRLTVISNRLCKLRMTTFKVYCMTDRHMVIGDPAVDL